MDGKASLDINGTRFSKGLQIAGVSEQKANTIAGYTDAGIRIALTAGAGTILNTAKAEKVTVYRGVNESHPGFADATKGSANPRGGAATAAEHNAGNTSSRFTSWTTNKNVAINYAKRLLSLVGQLILKHWEKLALENL